jgi:Protein of unknown function (DUF1573)
MRVAALLFLALTGSALGQLQWENPEQTFNVKAEDKTVLASYRFKNTGQKAVRIESVKTSCGCTTAALAKSEYAPGESGEIEAKFKLEGRTGEQEKIIMVKTSGAPDKPTFLQLMVNIEEPVKITPEFVLWRVGEHASKIIHISVSDDVPAKVLSVTSEDPVIKVQVTEIKLGKEYEVQVTPVDTTRPAGTTLVIRTDYPSGNPQLHYAYARIK